MGQAGSLGPIGFVPFRKFSAQSRADTSTKQRKEARASKGNTPALFGNVDGQAPAFGDPSFSI